MDMNLQNGFQLHEWRVDPNQGRIVGPEGYAHLTPRSMDVLILLAERSGEVVTRDEFAEKIWSPALVSEGSLSRCIGELRRHLGDDAGNPRFIQTVPKRGYMLVAPVQPLDPSAKEGPAAQIVKGKRPSRLMIALVVVILIAGIYYLSTTSFSNDVESNRSLAVLPFAYLSPDREHAYFSGGLHDELLTQLSKAENLSLRGRTSVMGYAETTKPISQIADELRVEMLVEGSVQVIDKRLRVNVQLIDAATDEHLWAESYDRSLDDAFAIQSDIVQNIVMGVGAALGSSERRAMEQEPTTSPKAYRLFLQARDYHQRPGYDRHSWEIAQQLYEQALMLDPQFALAHVWLSEIHGLMHWHRHDPSTERVEEQRKSAAAAMELAPELPHARMAKGMWHYWGETNWEAALSELESALTQLPNDAGLIARIGYIHRRLGNWSQALTSFKHAAELNPRDVNLFVDLGGYTYRKTRKYAEAIDSYDRALALAPDFHLATVSRGWAQLEWHGKLDALREALDRVPENADLGGLGSAQSQRAKLLLLERDADRLLDHLDTIEDEILQAGILFMPKAMYAGWAHQLRGDGEAAYSAFSEAFYQLEEIPEELENDWRIRVSRGLALAGLDRKEEALSEARWLKQSFVYREDALIGTWLARDRAWILAQAGDIEAAIAAIEPLLAKPSLLTVHTLHLDPRWDPVRDHPRFQSLIESYSRQD